MKKSQFDKFNDKKEHVLIQCFEQKTDILIDGFVYIWDLINDDVYLFGSFNHWKKYRGIKSYFKN